MIAPRGLSLVELDHRASEPDSPYGIITVDCSNPREYDDGIAVQPLPWEEELYRVSVFAVDASTLYKDGEVMRQALDRTESRYDVSKTGREAYIPMLSEEIVKDFDFTQGNVRDALTVSFIIGKSVPPTELAIGFGRIEVQNNFDYKDFGGRCRGHEPYKQFGRAAALILKHLAYSESSDEEAVHNDLIDVARDKVWRRGSNINSAYMVGSNHLVAKMKKENGDLAIYRRRDMNNAFIAELFGPSIAIYSTEPGIHDGLGLDVYTRFTSPLRRLEDLVMHGLIRAQFEGHDLTPRDHKIVTAAVRRLNQRTATEQFNGDIKLSNQDVWGNKPRLLKSVS